MATTRNRKSSIDLLDPRIQDEVNAAVKDGRASIDEIVSMIKSMGGDASRSAVGRYVKTQTEKLEQFRQAQETAKVWVDKIGKEPEGDVGRLLIEMLRVISYKTMSDMDTAEPQDIMFLGKAIKDISSADKVLVERIAVVRKLVAEQAAKVAEDVTKTVRSAGMSDETVDLIRSKILGIGEQPAPKAAA
jgi:hypothetical protein